MYVCICLFLIKHIRSSFITYKVAYNGVCTSGDCNELGLSEICCFFIKRTGVKVKRLQAWKRGFGRIGV